MPSTGPTVFLTPIDAAAAAALAAGRAPGLPVAAGYPTECSAAIGRSAGAGDGLGAFFVRRIEDDAVVGEIGGSFVEPGTIEIGYAIVASAWGRGHATDAVRALLELAREHPAVARVVGHTPVDRPASGRVLEKAGFVPAGEHVDEHEGQPMRVVRWERAV